MTCVMFTRHCYSKEHIMIRDIVGGVSLMCEGGCGCLMCEGGCGVFNV